ncbi:MAG: hypothetical protein GYB67_07790 [Chloroflexi bacterium]|nr:hypothetical protein [Chloroflexota bacterium]
MGLMNSSSVSRVVLKPVSSPPERRPRRTPDDALVESLTEHLVDQLEARQPSLRGAFVRLARCYHSDAPALGYGVRGMDATSGSLRFDFAVFVVTDDTPLHIIYEHVERHLLAGASLIWVLNPRMCQVIVTTPTQTQDFGMDGILDGGEVLADLALPVRDIFAASS